MTYASLCLALATFPGSAKCTCNGKARAAPHGFVIPL